MLEPSKHLAIDGRLPLTYHNILPSETNMVWWRNLLAINYSRAPVLKISGLAKMTHSPQRTDVLLSYTIYGNDVTITKLYTTCKTLSKIVGAHRFYRCILMYIVVWFPSFAATQLGMIRPCANGGRLHVIQGSNASPNPPTKQCRGPLSISRKTWNGNPLGSFWSDLHLGLWWGKGEGLRGASSSKVFAGKELPP